MKTPTSVWEWILSILLFIVSLGVLITIHELGHFSMAKAFNVYCQEFSIGFGPAIIHKRKKGKETYFSLRAIPLGGYVSMYGEDIELEDGVYVPKDRSLEGIKRWKKSIILLAGIIMNTILALTLFSISNICFPLIMATNIAHVEENSIAANAGINENDRLTFVGQEMNGKTLEEGEITYTFSSRVYYQYETSNAIYAGYFYIVDDDVEIDSYHYVMTYYPVGNKTATRFIDGFKLYPADTTDDIKNDSTFSIWSKFGLSLTNYPNYKVDPYIPQSSVSFDVDTYFLNYQGDNKWDTIDKKSLHTMHISSLENNSKWNWEDIGLSFILQNEWLPFGDRIANTFIDFGNASIAVFRGIGSLFTGGIKGMSGIVGIMQTSASVFSSYSFSQYLYFWGLISVNLAIFNLLPFPGLDGWALLVTIIEGSTNAVRRRKFNSQKKLTANENVIEVEGEQEQYQEWKIPTKVKNIISTIGLILLFLLMAVIVVFDIIRWVA